LGYTFGGDEIAEVFLKIKIGFSNIENPIGYVEKNAIHFLTLSLLLPSAGITQIRFEESERFCLSSQPTKLGLP
jgi:hypothetical protein